MKKPGKSQECLDGSNRATAPATRIRKQLSRLIVKLAADSLARDLYGGILDREPEPEGLSSSIASIRQTGGIAALTEGILTSEEFQQKSFATAAPELATAASKAILGREPDPEALKEYTDQLISDHDLAGLLSTIVGSVEFKRNAFLAAAPDLVTAAYKGILGREPDPEGLARYTDQLISDHDLAALLSAIVGSVEFERNAFLAAAPDFVTAAYKGILGREPDPEGLTRYTDQLMSDHDLAGLLRAFIESLEFRRTGPFAAVPELVSAAYERILQREPDEEGLKIHIRRLERDNDIEAWLGELLACPEFVNRTNQGVFVPNGHGQLCLEPPARVDIEATPEQLDLLFDRIRAQWSELGDTEPHWSVLVSDKYKSENFAKNEEEFYETGRVTFSMIESFFKRAGLEINPEATVLELGCGTGRVTHALADIYAHVVAVDVSPGNMRLCQEKLRQRGKRNVECVLLKSPRDIESLPPVDFFFSTIVLQHNPPPVIHYLLSEIFGKIRESGFVLFQVPTHTPGYSFNTSQYIESAAPVMEMHCLPMQAVFALFAKHRLRPIEALMDGMTGWLGSHTFFATSEK